MVFDSGTILRSSARRSARLGRSVVGGRYFDVIDTEYVLRKMNAGTELRVTMRYRVSTAFNWYTQPIAEFLVGNFEEAALRFYAIRAEKR